MGQWQTADQAENLADQMHHSSLTDGLEALKRVGDTEEVLPVYQTTVGVEILACLWCCWEVRGAVDQPEALMFVQQNHS